MSQQLKNKEKEKNHQYSSLFPVIRVSILMNIEDYKMLDATVYTQNYSRSNRYFYATLHKNMIHQIYMSNEEHKNSI